LGKSVLRSAATTVMPQSPVIFAPPLAEVAFLVEAAADPKKRHWSDAVTGAFSQLAATDQRRQETASLRRAAK
jgi:phytoene synthase